LASRTVQNWRKHKKESKTDRLIEKKDHEFWKGRENLRLQPAPAKDVSREKRKP